jgi:hypothetical protein
LIHHKWWPLTNSRTVVQVLELAARIALVTADSSSPALPDEAKIIYTSREQAGTKFQHLCLTLEVAAFAALAGWTVSYEEHGSSGRRPDLTVRRSAATYVIEVTVLSLDREFRANQLSCDRLQRQLRVLEHDHGVEIACRAVETLSEKDQAAWLDEIRQACQRTAADVAPRTISRGESKADVFAAGQRPPGQIFSGPALNTEVWQRVANRIADKARQTTGTPAWLRIDDTGTLFHLTDRSTQPLQDLLADLQLNATAALNDAPHVRGIILSTGVLVNPGNRRDETVWDQAVPAMLITPGPPRQALATGPAAMSRLLPGRRCRLTFVLPRPRPHLVLPSGPGPAPGLWYHDEPSWFTYALQSLGHPPLEHRSTADADRWPSVGLSCQAGW